MADPVYPRGQLCAEDEGQLALRVGVRDRTVIIDFGKPVAWLGCSASDARTIASLLTKHADAIDSKGAEKQ